MFNALKNKTNLYRYYLCSNKIWDKFYKSQPLLSFHIERDIFIHTGNSMIWKNNLHLFISRNIKYNVFFKKPLVRPTKRKKK